MVNKLGRVNLLPKTIPATGTLRFPAIAIGFADEIGELRGRLSAMRGAILIPNGRDWLAREIRPFVSELCCQLFTEPCWRSVSYWRDDIELGLQEALSNSFAHAVREKGNVWVRWRTAEREIAFEVIDEGDKPFGLDSRSSLREVSDALGNLLAGRGIGMQYIRRAADRVEVEPLTGPSGRLLGNAVRFVKLLP